MWRNDKGSNEEDYDKQVTKNIAINDQKKKEKKPILMLSKTKLINKYLDLDWINGNSLFQGKAAKLQEKVKYLEEKIFKLQSESRGESGSSAEVIRAVPVMEDMRRLLAHRDEIRQIKKMFKQIKDGL